MDQEDIKELFEEKYADALGMDYDEWAEKGPEDEQQAYQRLNQIDHELERTYDEWFEGEGDKKDKLGEYREKLKKEYDFIEQAFGLEAGDKDW
jgi:hypothetical protein